MRVEGGLGETGDEEEGVGCRWLGGELGRGSCCWLWRLTRSV
jgi:hypothetical protein